MSAKLDAWMAGAAPSRARALCRRAFSGLTLRVAAIVAALQFARILRSYVDSIVLRAHSGELADWFMEVLVAYGRLLVAGGVVGSRRLRCGLLFTAEREIRWVER